MERTVYTFPKRIIAMMLSIVMVFSLLPAVNISAAAKLVTSNKVVDGNTMDDWKDFFDHANISTEHAGGVWTDKSVFSDASAFAGVSMTNNANFLVALSALAGNSIVVGKDSAPTDTTFILDVSNSMDNAELASLVNAVNSAIHTLMTINEKNRVGVVLYATEVQELLPMDHYEPVNHNGSNYYISYNNSVIRTGVQTRAGSRFQQAQYAYIKDSAGNTFQNSASTGGGTYIQGGLWGAMNIFTDVADTTGQTPVIVLMSDGAPTYTSSNYSNVGNNTHGAGNSSFPGDGFVTQLTAAYVKEQIAAKYAADGDGVGNQAYLYTVGFGVDSVTNSEVAKAVVDPTGSPNADITNLWNTFNGAGNTMNVGLGVDGRNGDYATSVTITKNASLKNKQNYVNRYFAASQTADLNTAFRDVVNEIGIQAGYYPTRLDDNGANYSGYITFTDHIGNGMEVKDIKGIMLDGKIYTGQHLAQIVWQTDQNNQHGASYDKVLGTKDAPTALGDELVRAVKERFGITAATNEEANNIAWALIGNAWSTGQLSYNPTTKAFSNYIGWYGDAQGNYLGYDANAAKNAVYYNECYGMLGADDDYNTMYIAIQVSTEIATGNQMVTFRVPAALLPVVGYQITVDGTEITDSSKITLTYDAAQPIRLIYEVGIREDVNELNVDQYGTLGADGKYYLYTNSWDLTVGTELDKNVTHNNYTYSYFEPGAENEHYYFTEDSLVLDANHNPVKSIVSGQKYYFAHRIFTTATSGAKDAAKISYRYEELSATALAAAKTDADGNYVIPKGIMHHNMHSHEESKAANATQTYGMVRKQFVDATVGGAANHHYELTYLGNNGRVSVDPAQGIRLTKEMVPGVSAAGVKFSFTITLTAPAGAALAPAYEAVFEAADGTQTEGTVDVSGGKIQVQLAAGESVYIMDLPTGTTYSITESDIDGYKLSGSTNATGTVQQFQMSAVTFTNDAWDLSTLTVSKVVHYLKGSQAVAGKLHAFPVTVTLTRPNGDPYAGKVVNIGTKEYTTDADGRIFFTITDGQTITITNIPVGVTYLVEETVTGLPAGYTAVDAVENGTATATGAAAVLRNQYEPQDVTIQKDPPSVDLVGTKVVVNAAGVEIPWLDDFQFTFTLYRYDASTDTYAVVGTPVTVKAADAQKQFSISLAGQTFNAAGVYSFYVAETVGTRPGMTYDRAFHEFEVVVTDNDLDGKLEISNVRSVQHATVTGDATNGWTVSADYENVYEVHSTKLALMAHKVLNGRGLINGEFSFTVTETDASWNPISAGFSDTEYNDAQGNVAFEAITLTREGMFYFTVKENTPNGNPYQGVTYDTKEYRVAVRVEAGAGGQLEVTSLTIDGAAKDPAALTFRDMTFTNTYEAAGITADPIVGNKVLINVTPGAGNAAMSFGGTDFSFTLTGEGVNETVYAGVDGKIAFSAISYNKVGTYVYEVVENATAKAGVTVDSAKYTVTVVVADDGLGKLYVESTTYVKDGTIAASAADFRNTYLAKPTTQVTIFGDKSYNKPLKGGDFSFQLKQGDKVIETVKNAADGSFTFSGLTFGAAGTYQYTVTEVKGDKGYITYDNRVANITVVVEDNGAGQLVVTTGYSVDAGTFTNTYHASEAKVQLAGHKHMSGRPLLQDDVFEFTLTGPNVNATVKNDEHGIITFPELTFTQAGTYVYTIQEITAGANGVTKDPVVHTVTIVVTDNELGQLVATVNDAAPENYVAEFVNRYEAAQVQVTITGNKTYNAVLTDGKFQFQIEAVTPGAPLPAQTTVGNVGGKLSFGSISFDSTGMYEYIVREVIPADAVGGVKDGVYYDATVYHIVIEITDNLKGQLVAKASVNGADATMTGTPAAGLTLAGMDFANQYHTAGTFVTFRANKLFNHYLGEALKADAFAFQLKAANASNPMPVHAVDGVVTVYNDADGNIVFPAIPFETAGTYVYYIQEVHGGMPGMNYDARIETITVVVEDNGAGQLVAKIGGVPVNGPVDLGSFTNTYQPENVTVSLKGTKSYNKQLGNGDFTFRLEALDGGSMPAGAVGGVLEVKNAGNAIAFGSMTFDKPGIFHYNITEVADNQGGVRYDDHVYHVRVEVVDVNGKLQATVTVNGHAYTDALVVFTNTYTAASVDVVIQANKELKNETPGVAGNIALQGGEFSFVLTGPNADETVANAAGGAITFSKLTFTQAGSYTYTIREVAGDKTYITYADAVKITIVVEDDGNGRLVAKVNGVTLNGKVDAGTFTNIYRAADAKLALMGQKNYTNVTPGAGNAAITLVGGEFEFTLTAQGGAPMPAGNTTGSVTVANEAGGAIHFPEIVYTAAGTYTYTIVEVCKADGTDGVDYDETVHTVTVTVTDQGDGTMKAVATSNGDVTFFNQYLAAPTKVTFQGTKKLHNLTPGIAATQKEIPLQGGEFSFLLEGKGVREEQSNGAGGTIRFSELTFSEEGEYEFVISEQAYNKNGITSDSNTYKVIVKVKDNGAGQLVATIAGGAAENFTFEFVNTYKADKAKLILSGLKQLINTTPGANNAQMELKGSEFQFTLRDENGKEIETVSNAAGGAIRFQELEFSAVGEYKYTVEEVRLADGTNGVTYDKTIHNIVVKVTDQGDGTMKASVISSGDITFRNAYLAQPAKVDLKGTKYLENLTAGVAAANKYMDLRGGEFSFTLKDANGQSVQTITNGADGVLEFDTLTFQQAGTYIYTIHEEDTSATGVTKDTTIHVITIVVSDKDSKGQLVAEINGMDAAAFSFQFVNTYVAAEMPDTGDAGIFGLAMSMGLSAVSMLAVLIIGKKKQII